MEEIANEYLKTKNSSWDYYVDEMQSFNDISLWIKLRNLLKNRKKSS